MPSPVAHGCIGVSQRFDNSYLKLSTYLGDIDPMQVQGINTGDNLDYLSRFWWEILPKI